MDSYTQLICIFRCNKLHEAHFPFTTFEKHNEHWELDTTEHLQYAKIASRSDD